MSPDLRERLNALNSAYWAAYHAEGSMAEREKDEELQLAVAELVVAYEASPEYRDESVA